MLKTVREMRGREHTHSKGPENQAYLREKTKISLTTLIRCCKADTETVSDSYIGKWK